MGFWGELQYLKTEFFYHFLKLTIERIWMDLFRFSVYSFLWKMSDGRDQKKERWRSLVARREELWVTQRNERCNSHKKREKERKGGRRRRRKKRSGQPTKWRRATHSKKAWPIDPSLSLSSFLSYFFLCVYALCSFRGLTKHPARTVMAATLSPLFSIPFVLLLLLCCIAQRLSFFLFSAIKRGRVFNGLHTFTRR